MKTVAHLLSIVKNIDQELKALEAHTNIDMDATTKRRLLEQVSALMVEIALLENTPEPIAQPWPDEPVVTKAPIQLPVHEKKQVPVQPAIPLAPAPEVPRPEEVTRTIPMEVPRLEDVTRTIPKEVPRLEEVTRAIPKEMPRPAQKATLQETAAQQTRTGTINEKMNQPADKNLGDKLKGKPIINLNVGTPLNDRALIVRNLFKGNATEYENAIKQLDAFNNAADAMSYIKDVLIPAHKWDSNDEAFQSLLQLIRRRYLA